LDYHTRARHDWLTFAEIIGTEWIATQPDARLQHICEMARRHGVAIELLRQHRKINTLRIGSEAWSTPGVDSTVVELHPYGKVGILICADACSPGIAAQLKANGFATEFDNG
jgi:hypothetical protein